MKVPDAVAVPLMVITSLLHVALIPAGRPTGVPIPVAPVVAMVMLGVNAVLMQIVRGAGTAAVLFAMTVMVPVAFTVPHPPVSGME